MRIESSQQFIDLAKQAPDYHLRRWHRHRVKSGKIGAAVALEILLDAGYKVYVEGPAE